MFIIMRQTHKNKQWKNLILAYYNINLEYFLCKRWLVWINTFSNKRELMYLDQQNQMNMRTFFLHFDKLN